MFKNLIIYRVAFSMYTPSGLMEEHLQAGQFMPCGASQERSVGWIPPRGDAHGKLLEVVAGQWIAKLCIETKQAPSDVLKRKVEEQCAAIEETTGRKPGKKERREISEDVRLALLPMAFTKIATVNVWINPETGIMGIDASSQSRADEVVTQLVKAVNGISMRMMNPATSPRAAMTTWLAGEEPGSDLVIDRKCLLVAEDETKAKVKYDNHALDIEQIREHIKLGKMCKSLAMTSDDRVSFTLTDTLQIKGLQFLDVVFENGDQDSKADKFDVDVTLTTAELEVLITNLISALGGDVTEPESVE